jgi:Flp pilus assembly protein TadD
VATNDRATYLSLIRTMQERGLFYASLAHIDAFRAAYGDSPELSRLQADALRETDQQDRAMERYRGLLASSQAAAAWHGIGLIEARQGHIGEATHALDEAVNRDPTNAVYLGDLGYARIRADDDRGAREPLAKAAELDPRNAKAVANLALLFTLEGDGATATQLMDRAGLSATARSELQRLAGEIRRDRRPGAATTMTQGHTP